MKKFGILLMAGLLYGMTATAQKLYFCSDYTDLGQPITVSPIWTINSGGGAVYFLFQKDAAATMPQTIIFHISKLSGKDYVPFDVKSVTPESNKSFCVLDYKFLTPGSYMVALRDDAKELVTDYVTIQLKETPSSTSSTSTGSSSGMDDDDYYASAVITTGIEIDDKGTVSGTSPYYTIPSSGAYVIVKLDNVDSPLNTAGLIVDVYKKDDAGKYQFFETKNFEITSTYYWTYFKYSFYNAGDYRFDIYSKEWAFINSSYVTIKWQ